MNEREVFVSDEFEVECPCCGGHAESGGCLCSKPSVPCSVCSGEGTVERWVEGMTTVVVD